MKDDESREGQAQGKGRKPKYVRITDYLDPEDLDKDPAASRGHKVSDIAAGIAALTPEEREQMETISRQIMKDVQARIADSLAGIQGTIADSFSGTAVIPGIEGLFEEATAPTRDVLDSMLPDISARISEIFAPTAAVNINALAGSTWPHIDLGMGGSLAKAARALSEIPPHVLRDAHVMATARDYLKTAHADVLIYLATDPAQWFPRDRDEEETVLEWNENPLEDLSIAAVSYWKELYGDSAPTAADVKTSDVQTAVDTVIHWWAEFLEVDFSRRGPATTVSRPSPVLTTDKGAHSLNAIGDGGRNLSSRTNKELKGRAIKSWVTMGGRNPVTMELTATHPMITDALGALYRKNEAETGQQHVLLSVHQITQQMMRTNNPSDEQKAEVEAYVDELRQLTAHADGTLFNGDHVHLEGSAVMAYKTVVTTAKGNTVTGYQLLDAPVMFKVSELQNSARQVDAILEPRKGGWRPPRIAAMSVYTHIARKLFEWTGSKFDPKKAKYIYYSSIQGQLGGDYAPDVITAKRERTVRDYVEKSLTELQARGFIERFVDIYSGRKKIGFNIWIPKERPDLTIHPEDRRRLEARKVLR